MGCKEEILHVGDMMDCGDVENIWCTEIVQKLTDRHLSWVGKNYSINEIAVAFGDYPTEYIDKGLEMRNTLNTDTKAKDLLGWKPTVDILDYIKIHLKK